MNRGKFCHQWWQELSRILSSYTNPTNPERINHEECPRALRRIGIHEAHEGHDHANPAFGWIGLSERSKTDGTVRPTSSRFWAATPTLAPSGQPSSSKTSLPWKLRGSSR